MVAGSRGLGPAKQGALELTLVLGPKQQVLADLYSKAPSDGCPTATDLCVPQPCGILHPALGGISMQSLSLQFLRKFSTYLRLIGILPATFFYSYSFPSCAPFSQQWLIPIYKETDF